VKAKTLTKYFEYLDRLRESGATNMFGAGPWLEKAFGLSREKSTPIVRDWMKTFDPNKTAAERAAALITAGQGGK
jgi:hypothetical protein